MHYFKHDTIDKIFRKLKQNSCSGIRLHISFIYRDIKDFGYNSISKELSFCTDY